MIVAVMQPYFFPYLGYYQLAESVDHFVFLDDANFIRRGHIHRNRILLDGQPFRFVLPVCGASQSSRINQLWFSGDHRRFLQQLRHAYHSAPFFEGIYSLIESICQQSQQNVAQVCADSITRVFDYLGKPLQVSRASSVNSQKRGQERILELCRYWHAEVYHNASGGRHLYDQATFNDQGIELRFVRGFFPDYCQVGRQQFVSELSMIDVLMNNSIESVNQMLALGMVEQAA